MKMPRKDNTRSNSAYPPTRNCRKSSIVMILLETNLKYDLIDRPEPQTSFGG